MAMSPEPERFYYPSPPVGQGRVWLDASQVARYHGTGEPLDLTPKALRRERDQARRDRARAARIDDAAS